MTKKRILKEMTAAAMRKRMRKMRVGTVNYILLRIYCGPFVCFSEKFFSRSEGEPEDSKTEKSGNDQGEKEEEEGSKGKEEKEEISDESDSDSDSDPQFPKAGKRKGGNFPESKTKKKRRAFYDDL
jgi:hypothetical protein